MSDKPDAANKRTDSTDTRATTQEKLEALAAKHPRMRVVPAVPGRTTVVIGPPPGKPPTKR
jgi:hypothetical protein